MEERKNEEFFEKAGHRTIFHELINSPHLPDAEKGTIRVIQEAGAMVGAGGESTSQVLTAMTYCILSNPSILQKLRAELKTLMPTRDSPLPQLRELEKLPYLTGCVKEGLRLRTGKIARHQRLPRDKPLFYKDWEIPAGTIVSMTPIFNHTDPSIYPSPHTFMPERWLNLSPSEYQHLEHYFVPYSKGSRQCSGLSLANAELYLAPAALVTRFDLEVFESNEWDCEMAVDDQRHSPVVGSQGVRVVARESYFWE